MKVLVLLFLSFSFAATAAVETHVILEKTGDIPEKTISVEVPKEWQSAKDLFGLPLSLLGPEENEARPAMSFSYTGMTKKIMTPEKFRELFKEMKQGKERWATKLGAKLLMFEQPTSVAITKEITGHFIGAEFMVQNEIFTERSYYLYCKDEVYHVKWMLREGQKKHMKDIETILRSFSCK